MEARKYTNRCTNLNCRKQENILSHTIFAGSKLTYIKILRILELWLEGASRKLISYILDISKETITTFYNKLRKKVVPSYYKDLQKIGAPSTIVEIDESKFGKRKYHRGHQVNGVWVLGAIERTERRRLILTVVEKRDRETLEGVLKNKINAESTVFTDCWKGYNKLEDHFECHKTVNHSQNFVNPLDGTHTNTIEGTWFAVKATVPNICRTEEKIELYLFRFMLLRNEEGDPLENLIKYL